MIRTTPPPPLLIGKPPPHSPAEILEYASRGRRQHQEFAARHRRARLIEVAREHQPASAVELMRCALDDGLSPRLADCQQVLDELGLASRAHEPKTCSRCGNTYPRGDFPVTTARGRQIVRSWCGACCREYWRERGRGRRVNEQRRH